jgi:hypothetical protein
MLMVASIHHASGVAAEDGSSGTWRNNHSNSNKIVVRRHPKSFRPRVVRLESLTAQWRFRHMLRRRHGPHLTRATERQAPVAEREALRNRSRRAAAKQQSGPSSEEVAVAAMARQSAAHRKVGRTGAVLQRTMLPLYQWSAASRTTRGQVMWDLNQDQGATMRPESRFAHWRIRRMEAWRN